ncbi:MAG: TlpA family protein disulfide reductase [Armatimonadetes bacterium]|nr:TlpA family protein disulfide reductase [Armatimonadota bacterium]
MCREEFPHLKKIDEKYRSQGVQVISVPLETSREAAGAWSKEFKAAFPVIFDPKQKIAQDYGVTAIPFNVAIDREGKVAKILVGAAPEELEKVAKQLAARK